MTRGRWLGLITLAGMLALPAARLDADHTDAVIAIAPEPAAAESPVARLTLYEVNEALSFKPRGAVDPADLKRRLAQASLLGVDVAALTTGSVFTTGAFVKADGSSNVNLATGHGPVRATIQLLQDTDPLRNSLDTLLITAVLHITADLDQSTAGTTATVGIAGRWRAEHSLERGTFTGVFLIPLQVGSNYYYADPAVALPGAGFLCKGTAAGGLCPVDSTEFVLGVPLTKTLLLFSE